MSIAFDRSGRGEPLVLLHGIGMSRAAWSPVIPRLSAQRDVIAVDLPGHGDSPMPPAHLVPAPPGFAHILVELLDGLGIDRAHFAGNSLGGWTALELGKRGRARSVVAFGPAGLWSRDPLHTVTSLRLSNFLARRIGRQLRAACRSRAGRTLVLAQNFGRPGKVPPDACAEMVATLAATRDFRTILATTHRQRFTGGQAIDVPVTIVFGRRERLVARGARRREELPPHTRWLEPPGLGHVPMWDDPELVSRIILDAADG